MAFRWPALIAWTTGTHFRSPKPELRSYFRVGGVGRLYNQPNRWTSSIPFYSVRAIDIASELFARTQFASWHFHSWRNSNISRYYRRCSRWDFESQSFKKINLLEAQVDTVTETVWHTVTLHAQWFTMLCHSWDGTGNDCWTQFWEVLFITMCSFSSPIHLTFLLFAIRFVMIYGFYAFSD